MNECNLETRGTKRGMSLSSLRTLVRCSERNPFMMITLLKNELGVTTTAYSACRGLRDIMPAWKCQSNGLPAK